jgi:hypothetical protein
MTECVVKELHDVKFIGSKPVGTKNPTLLRVGVSQEGCNPWVILTAYMPMSCSFSATG